MCPSVSTAYRCTGRGAAGGPVALAQQDSVDVEVLISMRVTQVQLEHLSGVTIQSTHQGAISAQLLERGPGLSSPAALQEENTSLTHRAAWNRTFRLQLDRINLFTMTLLKFYKIITH